jgi:hypothetical protein
MRGIIVHIGFSYGTCKITVKPHFHVPVLYFTCLTVIVNKRQVAMPYGGGNCKQHSMQAGTLKNCDEQCKIVLYYSTLSCFNNFTMFLVLSILNMQVINSFYKYLKIKW